MTNMIAFLNANPSLSFGPDFPVGTSTDGNVTGVVNYESDGGSDDSSGTSVEASGSVEANSTSDGDDFLAAIDSIMARVGLDAQSHADDSLSLDLHLRLASNNRLGLSLLA